MRGQCAGGGDPSRGPSARRSRAPFCRPHGTSPVAQCAVPRRMARRRRGRLWPSRALLPGSGRRRSGRLRAEKDYNEGPRRRPCQNGRRHDPRRRGRVRLRPARHRLGRTRLHSRRGIAAPARAAERRSSLSSSLDRRQACGAPDHAAIPDSRGQESAPESSRPSSIPPWRQNVEAAALLRLL